MVLYFFVFEDQVLLLRGNSEWIYVGELLNALAAELNHKLFECSIHLLMNGEAVELQVDMDIGAVAEIFRSKRRREEYIQVKLKDAQKATETEGNVLLLRRLFRGRP